MPTSQFHQINEIVELMFLTRPASILDAGIGFGKYGMLAREYLDVWNRRRRSECAIRIDGIEVFREYLNSVHDFVYNRICVGDAVDVVPRLDLEYDVILLIDVIDHLDRERRGLLLNASTKRGRNLMISTPKDIGHKGAFLGNAYESHRAAWTRRDLSRLSSRFILRNRRHALLVRMRHESG